MAYKVACLGITDRYECVVSFCSRPSACSPGAVPISWLLLCRSYSDWKVLAVAALQAMKLDVARKAFIRIRDMRFIDLLYVTGHSHSE